MRGFKGTCSIESWRGDVEKGNRRIQRQSLELQVPTYLVFSDEVAEITLERVLSVFLGYMSR